VANYWVGYKVSERAVGPLDKQPFLLVWGFTGLVLFMGFGIPSAIATISDEPR